VKAWWLARTDAQKIALSVLLFPLFVAATPLLLVGAVLLLLMAPVVDTIDDWCGKPRSETERQP
jgi:hypothetical protein